MTTYPFTLISQPIGSKKCISEMYTFTLINKLTSSMRVINNVTEDQLQHQLSKLSVEMQDQAVMELEETGTADLHTDTMNLLIENFAS